MFLTTRLPYTRRNFSHMPSCDAGGINIRRDVRRLSLLFSHVASSELVVVSELFLTVSTPGDLQLSSWSNVTKSQSKKT